MSCGGQASVIDALVVVDANYGGGERFLPEGERERERERSIEQRRRCGAVDAARGGHKITEPNRRFFRGSVFSSAFTPL
jgi:hypothetical protein